MHRTWVDRARGALLMVAASVGGAATAGEPLSQRPLDVPDLAITTTGWVYALARQSDGSVIVGGDFIRVNGERRRNLARITAQGTLDAQWDPAPDGIIVDALAVDAQDRVYVAGTFDRIGGAARHNLARLDGHGRGTADANWQVAGAGGVTRLAVDGSVLYVGGAFDAIANEPRNGLARIRADGSLDPDWAPQPDTPDIVALALDGAHLYLAGGFHAVDGSARNGLARVSIANGVVDPGWNPAPAPDGSEDPPYQGVASLVAHQGVVHVGGTFRRIANADRANLAALSAVDGGVLPFGAPAVGPVARLVRDDAGALYVVESDLHTIHKLDEQDGSALAFASPQVQVEALVADDERVTVGGYFDAAPGRDDVSLMRLEPDGVHGNTPWTFDRTGYVHAVKPLHDGSLLVGGNFRRVEGQARHGIAHVLADGGLDATFDLAVDDGASTHAFAEDAQGRIYVAGIWQQGGVNGSVVRVDAHGAIDPDWAPQADGIVWDVVPDAGDVFLAGDFRHIGATWRPGIAKLGDGTGAPLDPDWNPQPTWSGSPGYVFDLVAAAGSIYASGQFDTIGGEARTGLARLQRSGTGTATAWNPAVDGTVNAMLPVGGAMVLAGAFGHVGSDVRNGLAKVDLQGDGALLPWDPLGSTAARFVATAPADDGAIYAFGWRDVGTDAVSVLRIDGGGVVDAAWRVHVGDVDHTLETIAGDGAGSLWLGGSFDRVGGRCRLGLAAVGAQAVVDRVFDDGFEACP